MRRRWGKERQFYKSMCTTQGPITAHLVQHTHEVITRWQRELKDKFYIHSSEINTLLSADDQVDKANSESHLQKTTYKLSTTGSQ
jgi:hypothetical protein